MTTRSSTDEQSLDHLQAEINRILEQTGRIFAAANSSEKPVPTAQIIKLKKILPGANDNFHEAVDQLEERLQLAKLVLRRDLAVCREEAGMPAPVAPTGPILATSGDTEVTAAESNEPQNEPNVDDEVMEASKVEPSSDAPAVLNEEQPVPEEDPAAKVTVEEHPTTATELQADSQQEQDTAADTSLHVDTQAQPQSKVNESEPTAEDDNPPDTGTFSTNDLDSLFGGPMSAGLEQTTDFNMDTGNVDEFDFDAFSASLANNNATDDNNLSSFLPGLEDYANAAPAGDDAGDFNDFFSTLPVDGQGDSGQSNMQHRDSTFDDLFDLTDFNEFPDGSGGDGTNQNQNFDSGIE